MTQKGKFAPPNGWKSMVVKVQADKWIDAMVAVCEVCQYANSFNLEWTTFYSNRVGPNAFKVNNFMQWGLKMIGVVNKQMWIKYSIGMNFIHIISLIIQGIYFKMEMSILLTWKIWKVAQALISTFFPFFSCFQIQGMWIILHS